MNLETVLGSELYARALKVKKKRHGAAILWLIREACEEAWREYEEEEDVIEESAKSKSRRGSKTGSSDKPSKKKTPAPAPAPDRDYDPLDV